MIRTILTAPQTKLREGNVFTSVSLSTGEGGYRWSYVLPSGWLCQGGGYGNIGGYVHGDGYLPLQGQVCPREGGLSPTPESWDTTGYDRQAGGTYPSGMISSSVLVPVIPWLSENTHCS